MASLIMDKQEGRNFHTYIKPMDDPKVVDSVARNLKPAVMIDNAITKEERQWLNEFAFSKCVGVRHAENGTVFVAGNLHKCYEYLKDKIDAILPGAEKSPVVGGNFFITPSQYGLHNDAPKQSDYTDSFTQNPKDAEDRKYVTWRNVIIPLWQAPSDASSQIVFFDQRHIDWAHVYSHNGSGGKPATTYPIAEDHGILDFYNLNGKIDRSENLKPYDKTHYDKYLKSTPYERLTGLTEELTCEWTPGSIMVFDAAQLHATNQGQNNKNPWKVKMGLLLCFLREID